MEICLLLSRDRGGSECSFYTDSFQVPLIQNNQFARVSYLGMMYSQSPEFSSKTQQVLEVARNSLVT